MGWREEDEGILAARHLNEMKHPVTSLQFMAVDEDHGPQGRRQKCLLEQQRQLHFQMKPAASGG